MENENLNLESNNTSERSKKFRPPRVRHETLFLVVLWTVLLTLMLASLLSRTFTVIGGSEGLESSRQHKWADSYGLPYKPKGI